MKKILFVLAVVMLNISCSNGGNKQPPTGKGEVTDTAVEGSLLIASDIVTEVIIKPEPDGDPWEIDKVAGYKGEMMTNTIFERIYKGTLTVFDYHTGEPLSAREVKDLEKEFNNDRSRIGKLSFTEDWFYNPSENTIQKITKSIVLGFELYNNDSTVYGYKAAFKVGLGQ